MLDGYLAIGEVLKPQGVKGEIKVRPITSDPMRFEALTKIYWLLDGAYREAKVRATRIDPDAVYMVVEGVRDRDRAEALRGRLMYVGREDAIELPEDAEFIVDLIGCEATDDEGNPVGRLHEVLQPGASDVYVFRGARGEVLVPALKSVVLSVDVARKRILLSAKRLSEVAVYEE
ncbi:ribosome maturation factor RimM [Bacillota bacterium Meth-B3]